MKIKSGAEWENASGNRQTFEVTLEDADWNILATQRGWDPSTFKLTEKFETLQKVADKMVVVGMFKYGAISREYMQQRLAEIGDLPPTQP